MSSDEILRDIRAKKFFPVYFLHGEEPFFIDQVADAVEATALPEAEKGFNQTVLYGKDVDHVTLLDYLRRYPMMSERQVVILREAQEMKSLTELTAYMENPMPTTVFVVCHKHKKVDARTKFGKSLQAKHVVLLESKKLYDNQIADWISSFCKSHHLHIDTAAAALMAEYLGADLSRIANELDKLTLNLPKNTTITTSHIQEYVGISKEYNIFELQKALAMRNAAKVARIQHHFASNIRKNPLIVTITSLYAYFSKVFMLHALKGSADAEILKTLDLRSDWFLKEYRLAANHYSQPQTAAVISLLKNYDLRSKGIHNDNTSTGEEELMKELFWRILHV
ncbi:MAG: DNA polymerase III subunit delta [Saprospiraceae bacterium]|nr:DNA polymerase III subunit delta [Saprospiraceae bacterium]